MENIVSKSFSINNEKIKEFNEKGFLHLKGIFIDAFVESIAEKIDKDIASPSDKYQAGFSRIKFDLFDKDPYISSLMLSKKFRKIMNELTGRTLLYTQGLGFELEKNKSKGFPWHIGTQSFGYQKAEDFGCTIWTPLVRIDPKQQRGGMAYVPKNIVSGEFMYTHVDPAVFEKTRKRIDSTSDITIDEFVHLRDGPLNDPAMNKILNYFSVEDEFELGDALIFDKNVIHRSVMLDEGPINSRAAFAMRFVDVNSTYDEKRANNLEIPRKHFSYAGPTRFHIDVCSNDGDFISESSLFSEDREIRTLS